MTNELPPPQKCIYHFTKLSRGLFFFLLLTLKTQLVLHRKVTAA